MQRGNAQDQQGDMDERDRWKFPCKDFANLSLEQYIQRDSEIKFVLKSLKNSSIGVPDLKYFKPCQGLTNFKPL
jgi:hypothetical protein